MNDLPIIDFTAFRLGDLLGRQLVARQINEACRQNGFFYLQHHGIDPNLESDLEDVSRRFFSLPEADKMQMAMSMGGAAWRGYFPVGQELTSGKPDIKEGIYFGEELAPNHPAVLGGVPLFGSNLFPSSLPEMSSCVLKYMQAMKALSHQVIEAISLSLDLPADTFYRQYTHDPLTLFRIFHYPSTNESSNEFGVGEHTDYGLLTILKQDQVGGLEVKLQDRWIEAPPVRGAYVCNIGDMLEKLTGGAYVSTLHRVRNVSGVSRFSWPFFFDPGFFVKMDAIKDFKSASGVSVLAPDARKRWDDGDLKGFDGTYGEYILGKVARVFPQLFASYLQSRT